MKQWIYSTESNINFINNQNKLKLSVKFKLHFCRHQITTNLSQSTVNTDWRSCMGPIMIVSIVIGAKLHRHLNHKSCLTLSLLRNKFDSEFASAELRWYRLYYDWIGSKIQLAALPQSVNCDKINAGSKQHWHTSQELNLIQLL